MERKEFDALLNKHMGDKAQFAFGCGYEFENHAEGNLKLKCNCDSPECADINADSIVNIVGFIGDGEYRSFAVGSDEDNSPWAVGYQYFDVV